MKLAIVGAGAIGLATAWHAARRGHTVEVFEQGPIPNPLAASVDQHRLCRVPYGEQDGYAQLMAPAMAAWARLWAALGETHYAETGCLALHTAPGDWTERSRASLQRLGLPHRVLDPAEVAARCPFLRVDDARWGLWTAPGGVLFADAITAGLAHLAAAEGATLHATLPVTAVAPAGVVVADGIALSFDAVIVTAGAWTPGLAPWSSPGVTPVRQVVAYATPPAALRAAWAAGPILLNMGGPRGMYAAPPVGGRGLKFGCGALNQPGPPDARRTPEPGEGEAVLAAWRARLVDFASYRLAAARVCAFAGTSDERFVLARQGRVLAVTGCSGHAFKLAALLGEGLAAALAQGDGALAWMRGDAAAFDPRLLAA